MARRILDLILPVLTGILLSAAAAGAVISVEDDSGRSVELPGPAERVVSLYVGHSENIKALGKGSSLIAVSRADDPSLFPDLPMLNSRVDPEVVLELDPDLVIVRPMFERIHKGFIKTLEAGGITVCSLNPPSWDGMEDYLEKLGSLLGVSDPVSIWQDKMSALDSILAESSRRRADSPQVRVFLESVGKGLKTCSPDSWAARLISFAGGVNGASDARPVRKGSSIAPYGIEAVMDLASKGLDVYLIQVGPMNQVSLKDVQARPWIKGLGDARIEIVGEELVSRPSLYRMLEGAEYLMNIFYPEREE
jgi:iron complex transport system substrate-binding protein